MLYRQRPIILVSLAFLLTSLTACSGSQVSKNLEQSLAADPRLKDNPVTFGAREVSRRQNSQPTTATVSLPANFPKDIPLYPEASLQAVTPGHDSQNTTSTRWLSSDPSNFIANFYRQQFQANNWQILQQPADEQGGTFTAQRDDLRLQVTIQPKAVTNSTISQSQTATELTIDYLRNPISVAQAPSTPEPQTTNETIPQPGEPQFIGPVPSQNTPTPANTTTTPIAQTMSNLSKVPQEFQQYIQDLVALGVLSTDSNVVKSTSGIKPNQFEPNKVITRREYARWLVTANNAMHTNNPAKQIRLASQSNQPAFQDVPTTDPDFPIIQGLAEAGLIPSSLSGDSTMVLFRPNTPLTREQLILWKAPLDTRQALPSASFDTVRQTWGFQDTTKIDPRALRAVLADFQNGEQSNIRRVFGYTTLFQPKKSVTQAEAAAVLWYFGNQNDGISAKDAVNFQRSPSG